MQTDDIASSDPRLVKKGPDWGHEGIPEASLLVRIYRGGTPHRIPIPYRDVLESDQHPHDSDDECRQQVGNAHVRQAEEVRADTENQDIADGAEAL